MHSPITKAMTERVRNGLETAMRLGASGAKLALYRGHKTDCRFEAGRLKDTGRRETLSYSVEVLVNDRKGNTSGNTLADVDNLIEKAVALARVGSIAHFDGYPAPDKIPVIETYSERTLSLTREQMIQGCQQIADALKTYDPDLFIECSAKRTVSERLLVTTGGVHHLAKRTHWSLGAFVQRTTGTDMLFAGYGRGWCDLNEFYDPYLIAERIVTELSRAERLAKSAEGKLRVYLPPETLARLLSALFMGTNGRNVAKGDSPLRERLDEQVLTPALTIVDNPHRDYAGGAREIDNNGIPTRKQTVFDKGVLKRFLYDLDSAGLAGAEPTGNNGCSPYLPSVLPGRVSSRELLAEIDDGLYVRDLIGFGQSNLINGDFSANVGLGYRVRKGEIEGRVKNTMIAGNLYEILKRNVLLSSDMEHEDRYPHALIEGVSVNSG